jgi:hypothetical protein
MDLNQLLSNHQRALFNASRAGSADDKTTYFDLVAHYEKRLREHRDRLGLPRYSWFPRIGNQAANSGDV